MQLSARVAILGHNAYMCSKQRVYAFLSVPASRHPSPRVWSGRRGEGLVREAWRGCGEGCA